MTNEMMVRGAKSAKIGKSLTGYLILSADGGRVGGPDIQQSLYLKTYISPRVMQILTAVAL